MTRQQLIFAFALCTGLVATVAHAGKFDQLWDISYVVPDFLEGAPEAVQKQHRAIWEGGVKTKSEEEIIAEEQAWVAKQSPEIQVSSLQNSDRHLVWPELTFRLARTGLVHKHLPKL